MNMADAKEFRAVNLDPVPGHPLVPKLQLGNQGPAWEPEVSGGLALLPQNP